MPAPIKKGLDYFPMDTDTDDKIDLIERKYGLIGFGFVVKLFSKIYKNSYYYRFTDLEKALLSARLNIKIDLIDEILADCFLFGLLEKSIFEDYKILTSRGIQKRYFEATRRRSEFYIIDEILRINLNDYIKNEKVNIIKENANINGVNENNNQQTKVKKSKPKKEFSEDSLKFVKEFLKLLPEDLHPKNEKQISDWQDCYDKLISIDKKTKKEIWDVCKFARTDEFWKDKFLSPPKLRKLNRDGIKFFELFKLQMQRSNGQPKEPEVKMFSPYANDR